MIWAVKWSFVGLLAVALFQAVIIVLRGSVALLADTIHNFGDADMSVPLRIGVALARRKPSKRFTYGHGRVEDLAGVVIILTILFSAIVAGYESLARLFNPEPVSHLWAVIAASLIGFLLGFALEEALNPRLKTLAATTSWHVSSKKVNVSEKPLQATDAKQDKDKGLANV